MAESTRNPIWDRDETILALNLYFECGEKVPDKSDERVIELSNLLRRNPINAAYADRKDFRSPSAVVLKLSNLQQEATSRGMPNNSKVDKEVWAELGALPPEVANLAKKIAFAIQAGSQAPLNDDIEEAVFYEGRTFTKLHTSRERNPNLRRKVLDERERRHALKCEICTADFMHLPQSLRRSAFEVHHLVPLSESGARSVRIADLALLCATCHRLVHRLIADQRRWVSIAEAQKQLLGDNS